jgi:hypothetical protein
MRRALISAVALVALAAAPVAAREPVLLLERSGPRGTTVTVNFTVLAPTSHVIRVLAINGRSRECRVRYRVDDVIRVVIAAPKSTGNESYWDTLPAGPHSAAILRATCRWNLTVSRLDPI